MIPSLKRNDAAVASMIGLIALAATGFYGGWEWMLMTLAILAALWRLRSGPIAILAVIGVSFLWLALFHWTGDRRLFFPFSMQFAVQMPYLLEGRVSRPVIVGGAGLIAFFLLIRIVQAASFGVLLVELVVAVAVLALVGMLLRPTAVDPRTRLLAGMLGSTLAFVGLVF